MCFANGFEGRLFYPLPLVSKPVVSGNFWVKNGGGNSVSQRWGELADRMDGNQNSFILALEIISMNAMLETNYREWFSISLIKPIDKS